MKKSYIAPVSKTINLTGETPLLANSIDAHVIEGTTTEQGSNQRTGIWGDED